MEYFEGWYPSMDSAGEYVLYLVDTKKERPFERPIEEFRSREIRSISSSETISIKS